MRPAISIIICTKNRAESLRETLQSIGRVAVPIGYQVELLVIDNGSTDCTQQVVHSASFHTMSVRYIYEPQPGKGYAYNAGTRAAAGNVLLFTDDDVRLPASWIEDMCKPILDGLADAVQGGIRWSSELLQKYYPSRYVLAAITSTAHKQSCELDGSLIGANMAIRRDVINAIGGFDPELGPGALGFGDETLLGWQLISAGFRKINRLHVVVEHHFDPARLTRAGLLDLARKKGRSLGYIDYHWRHQNPQGTGWRYALLAAKASIRRLVNARSMMKAEPPEWEFAYVAELARLRQLRRERHRDRNYEFQSLRKS